MTLYRNPKPESETGLAMEISLNHTNTRILFSSLPIYMVQGPSAKCQRLKLRPSLNHGLSLFSKRRGLPLPIAVECSKLGSGPIVELEGALKDEMNPEEGAQWMSSEILREKCGEKTSFVDTLECLEREAIMGEDQGKEPNDYNRRAQIFDKSSRVFQTLKERSN